MGKASEEDLVKIAIMGTGGVGGVFGALLAEAGEDVTFIARGSHLAVMKEKGLLIERTVEAPAIHVKSPKATDDPSRVGEVDVVLFCVKLWDTESAAELIKPMIGKETAVISLQNGISKDEILASILGKDHMVGGVSYVASAITAPGVIEQRGSRQKLVFGEFAHNGATSSERVKRLEQACRNASIDVEVPDSIEKGIWKKFVFLVAMSSLCASVRGSIGVVQSNPRTRELFVEAMNEVLAVAAASGIDMPDGTLVEQTGYFESLSPEVTASMQFDLSQGNRLELPWLAGTVVELGEKLSVPTPVLRVINGILSPYANGALKP
ncbi:MAG: ketopantoate reductase family protein [Candidatus Obscuribacterales bacterium]